MPRGVYARKKASAVPVQSAPEVDANLAAEAKRTMDEVTTLAHTIRSNHDRISHTTIEIGRHFFEIKSKLEGINSTMRRQLSVPSWTVWMNTVAPEVCNMTSRTAWNYFRAYSETLASGLSEKTITALAPTVLKTEKARQAVVAGLLNKPELAQRLNEASRNPREIKKLAESDEMQSLIKRAEPREATTPAVRVVRAIVNGYADAFVQDENFDLKAANEALEELTAAINGAAQELGISDHLKVSMTAIRQADVKQPVAAPGAELPMPKTSQEAIENLSALIRSGAAKVVAVGA